MLTFTEDEIRAVWKNHHPTGPDQGERAGLCVCRYYSTRPAKDFTIDHLIEKLKEAREHQDTG